MEHVGMSSLEPKDAIPDFAGLNEAQLKTLDQWESFFEKVGDACLFEMSVR
jgi:membrane-associated progesterone receptor component